MIGEPFTPCKLRVVWGEMPPVGCFLVTRGGSAYHVDRHGGRTLHCTRWPLDEIPAEARTIEWEWAKRVRKRGGIRSPEHRVPSPRG